MERLQELSRDTEILEVRDDLIRGLDVDWLRSAYSGRLLYTLRSREEGGHSESSGERRCKRIIEAGRRFDLVDLELRRDMSSEILSTIPPGQRIISWHGPPSSPGTLLGILDEMSSEAAKYYKIIPGADQPRQEMAPLALLRSVARTDVVSFASGSIGTWTRLIAPRIGAPLVYGSATPLPGAPGQLSVDRLVRDFGLPELEEVQTLFGIIGAGIGHSLSPRLHNHFYRLLDLHSLYLPFDVEAFGEFWLEVVESGAFDELGLELRGLSVTTPYKRIASAVGGACSPLVEWLGSANTLSCRDGVWEAESTDGEGVRTPLTAREVDVKDEPAVVLGAGGAGRAAVVALRDMGAQVTLVNRGVDTGQRAAKELRVPFRSLEGFDPRESRVLVNATPLGRNREDTLPVDPERLARDAVVVDLVYHPDRPTRFVEEIRASGRQAIEGREVLVAQAIPQFRLMTGHEMSWDEARRVVGLE